MILEIVDFTGKVLGMDKSNWGLYKTYCYRRSYILLAYKHDESDKSGADANNTLVDCDAKEEMYLKKKTGDREQKTVPTLIV